MKYIQYCTGKFDAVVIWWTNQLYRKVAQIGVCVISMINQLVHQARTSFSYSLLYHLFNVLFSYEQFVFSRIYALALSLLKYHLLPTGSTTHNRVNSLINICTPAHLIRSGIEYYSGACKAVIVRITKSLFTKKPHSQAPIEIIQEQME